MAIDIRKLPKCLANPKHTIEPLWAGDAGRVSNSGKFSGTFIGWFDKLEISIGKTTYNEMMQIRNEIEQPIIDVTFLDSKTNQDKTEQFYGTAISAERNNSKTYKPFSFTLTAVSRR